MIRCDVTGKEPRDYTIRTLCGPGRVSSLANGQEVRIDAPDSERLRIQWLHWGDGATPELAATRELKAGIGLPVLAASSTFLSAQLGDYAPETALVASLVGASRPWNLRMVAGGEIFGRVDQAAVTPAGVEYVGPETQYVSIVAGGWFSASGLVPGSYVVHRVYAGGIRSPAIHVTVGRGRTTTIRLPAEEVGAITVSADAAYCHRSALPWKLMLNRPDEPSDRSVAEGQSAACEVNVAGVPPGDYVFGSIRPAGDELTIPRTHVTVSAQKISHVALSAPAVVVRGRASVRGAGLGGATVVFRADGRETRTVTGPDGYFATGLGRPGTYTVRVEGLEGSSAQRAGPFSEGENWCPVDIDGAGLSVTVIGPPARDNQLILVGPRETKAYEVPTPVAGWRLENLESGSYGLWMFGRKVAADAYTTFTIDDRHRTAAVTVRLVDHPVALKVFAGSVAPLHKIITFAGVREIPLESSVDGTFQLQWTPGAPLVIKTDDSVSCHRLDGRPSQSIVIPPAEARQELLFSKGADMYGRVEGMAGSSCGVSLNQAEQSAYLRDGVYHVVLHLPLGPAKFVSGERVYPLPVPGPPVVIR